MQEAAIPPANPVVPPLPTGLDLSRTFHLASRPDSTKTIFLDFDGYVTRGTYWNSKYSGGAPIVTRPYSIDSSPSFSDIELATIQCIWQRVAEDFAPFDINVTTIEPSSADLSRSGTGDERWGMRVNIGGAYTDWLHRPAGGIAVLGSFGKASDVGAFVFVEQRRGEEKYTADAISHEVGHTLGLNHKGGPGSAYYSGHGSGQTGWAPLMGAAYNKSLSQWSKGDYPGATNRQDELKVITTGKGVNYRDDDYGSTRSEVSLLRFSAIDGDLRTVSMTGVIERNTDRDWFAFATTGGAVSLDFLPAARGANLDLLAQIYDSQGALLASSNHVDRLDAELHLELPPGVYYVMVDGVGARGLSDGYSDYGSLGQYTISGTVAGSGAASDKPLASAWITGSVWHDRNGDGIPGPSDHALGNVPVFLDLDDDGSFDAGLEPTVLTNQRGDYVFYGLAAGTYRVLPFLSDSWHVLSESVVELEVGGLARDVDVTVLNPPSLTDPEIEVPVDLASQETPIAPGATVEDLDTVSFDGARLVIQIIGGQESTDRLSLLWAPRSSRGVTVVKSSVRFGGRVVGALTGGAGADPLVITFNSAATVSIVEAVLRSIVYRTTTPRPAVTEKAVRLLLIESSGVSSNAVDKVLRLSGDHWSTRGRGSRHR